MGNKYFTWSFDDGLEQDKKIIEILKEYGMGATFHLNSGLFGEKTYEGRVGNLGILEKPAVMFDPERRHLLPYVSHFRIPEDELRQVYEGFEIASHTKNHRNLTKCTQEELELEIRDDVAALTELFGREINGFAYPYGIGADKCKKTLRSSNIRYARTIRTSTDFRFPDDPLSMPMSCWHLSGKVFDRLNAFFRSNAEEEDRFFLMFAHGYEFDFETKESNWDKFRRICETVRSHNDIICCSIGDAFLKSGRWDEVK